MDKCPYCNYTGGQPHIHCANCGEVNAVHFSDGKFSCREGRAWKTRAGIGKLLDKPKRA